MTVTEPPVAEPNGRRRFLLGAGAAVGATALLSALPTGVVHAAPPEGASRFLPLPTAERVADTRAPRKYDFQTLAANRIRVRVAGVNGVAPDATAVVLTVTAVNFGEPNFVTVFPTGVAVPTVSNLNLLNAGDANANLVTVKIGNGGSVDLYSRRPCHMIVDVLGYYEPVTSGVRAGRFRGLSAAQRAIDTRPNLVGAGSFTTVDITSFVPEDASSVVINLTATETTGPSFFTALPFSATVQPATSSLNVSRAGETRAAGVIVPVTTIAGKRQIKIFSLHPAKIVVDVFGYFTGETSSVSEVGLFMPVDPERLIDTREPGGAVGKLWPNWVVEVPIPASMAANAAAVVVNVTGVESRGPGFLTVTGARQRITLTSNVNFSAPGQVVPNHVITPVTATHGLQVLSSHGAHVVVDIGGYFLGVPKPALLAKYVNPAAPAVPPPWILRVPRMGLTSTVIDGTPDAVTNSGRSWHWADTGNMGEEGRHVVLFAHRTSAGGPYRYLHYLQTGDEITVTTSDNREYTYRVVRRDLATPSNASILGATRLHPGTTLSLVACTVGYDRSKSAYPDVWAPTSVNYRIVVTSELVSWREL
jgi:LPXTG-site transpeptidase (sortase) family protein